MQFEFNPLLWLLGLATICGWATAVEPWIVDAAGYSPAPLDFFSYGPAPLPSSSTESIGTSPLPEAIANLLPVPPEPPPGAIVTDPTAAGSDQPPMPVGDSISRAAWVPISKTVGPDGCLSTPMKTTRPEGRSIAPADWDPNLQFVILVQQGFLTCIEYKLTEG